MRICDIANYQRFGKFPVKLCVRQTSMSNFTILLFPNFPVRAVSFVSLSLGGKIAEFLLPSDAKKSRSCLIPFK